MCFNSDNCAPPNNLFSLNSLACFTNYDRRSTINPPTTPSSPPSKRSIPFPIAKETTCIAKRKTTTKYWFLAKRRCTWMNNWNHVEIHLSNVPRRGPKSNRQMRVKNIPQPPVIYEENGNNHCLSNLDQMIPRQTKKLPRFFCHHNRPKRDHCCPTKYPPLLKWHKLRLLKHDAAKN